MARAKTWGEQRLATILQDAKGRYGAGWQHMSQDQRQNFIDSRILAVLMSHGLGIIRPRAGAGKADFRSG